ncbi:CoA transferase subunit A [Chloroflexota bacterium]
MKDKIYPGFDEAVADVFDGAFIACSTFGTASASPNLWEAIYNKDVKDLTLMANMVMPIRGEITNMTSYGPSHCVMQPGKVKKVITGFTSAVYTSNVDSNRDEFGIALEKCEVVSTTFGSICTHLEAAAKGYGGILSPVGVGTFMEGKMEKYVVDGKEYLLVKPLVPDFGFVKAQKADKLGNLYYRRGQRVHNPLVAAASKITIAEVIEIVEPGEIDPDHVHTPHIYVDRIVKIPKGGKGTPEWDDVSKALAYGPGGTTRQRMSTMTGRGM